jgi:N-acetylmuramoyl-L-alanine amidase
MKVTDGRLVDNANNLIPFQESPNHGGPIKPILLIVHFTASLTVQETVSWFMNPAAAVSSHLVIGRDGSMMQMVSFNLKAWHAGKSQWGNLDDLNKHSIGIELVNAGKLLRHPGQWVDWKMRVIPDSEVVELTHKNETTPAGWQTYTEAQIGALVDAASALHAQYAFLDIVGHDDVAPGRKVDPGPAFPMASFRAKVMGRA